jgi:hypothetical protein
MKRFFVFIVFSLLPFSVFAQSTILQAGPAVPGHFPVYLSTGYSTTVMDSGGASGGPIGAGPTELALTAQGNGTPPYANTGTGPFYTHFCLYDGPTATSGGRHYLCLDPNSGGGGLLVYGATAPAPVLPFVFDINGTDLTFVGGPASSVSGNVACWGNTTGSALTDCTTVPASHFVGYGTAPAVTSCGTGATITGHDSAGRIVVGSGSPTSCSITFNAAYSVAPVCIAQDETVSVMLPVSAVSTSGVTFKAATALNAADNLSFVCTGL